MSDTLNLGNLHGEINEVINTRRSLPFRTDGRQEINERYKGIFCERYVHPYHSFMFSFATWSRVSRRAAEIGRGGRGEEGGFFTKN